MNIIWLALIVVSVVFAACTGRLDAYTAAVFDAGKAAVEVSLFLLGIVALWMGITRIIEDSGLIHHLSRSFRPLIRRLFKGVPDDHPAAPLITLNFLANLFGLGNAATPLGIEAMHELQKINADKEQVSFEMMTFIVINTASIQLIPFSVIGILAAYGSPNPSAVVVPTLAATVISAGAAVSILFAFRRVLPWK